MEFRNFTVRDSLTGMNEMEDAPFCHEYLESERQRLSKHLLDHETCRFFHSSRDAAESIPKIPNPVSIVEKNIEYYGNSGVPYDYDNYGDVLKLDAAMEKSLHALFHLSGFGDVWPYVTSGHLAVSGSTLLMIMGHFPNSSDNLKFSGSDIDVYSVSRYLPTEMSKYEEMGFVKGKGGSAGSGCPNMERMSSPMPGFEGKVPFKMQIMGSPIQAAAANFDYRFLSNYFTEGHLHIMYPIAFITKLPLKFSDRNQNGRELKYNKRGYKTDMKFITSDLGSRKSWDTALMAYGRKAIRTKGKEVKYWTWSFDKYCNLSIVPTSCPPTDTTSLQSLKEFIVDDSSNVTNGMSLMRLNSRQGKKKSRKHM